MQNAELVNFNRSPLSPEITNNTSNTFDDNFPISTSSAPLAADVVGGDQTLISTGGSKNYASTAIVVDPNLTVSGTQTLNAARVLIGGFIADKDELGVSGQTGTSGTLTGGISWSYDDTTGVLSLDGDSTVANYQAALRSITYTNATPTDPGTARTIRFSLGNLLSNPENGHFYDFVDDNVGISWTAARDAAGAVDNTYFGRKGYLTTITSQEEQNFVQQRVAGNGWIGANDAETEGTWKWVTGPEAGTTFWNGTSNGSTPDGQYANWDTANNEPNDDVFDTTIASGEDYAHIVGNSGAGNIGKWNDLPDDQDYSQLTAYEPQGYIVEYGGLAGDTTQSIAGSVTVNFGGTNLNNPITTPDFNGDGNPELLWRNYRVSGGDSGKNHLWVLDYDQSATNKFPLNPATQAITPTVNSNWEIEGLFDFNQDGITDIVWRNYGTGANKGTNTIWIMKNDANGISVDTTKSGAFDAVTDTTWEIEGVADLDKDGNPNILWRNYGTGDDKGKNVIWEIDATSFAINAAETKSLTTVEDTTWEIEGWSDMTGDGTPDLIWRNYGTGTDQGKNAVWKLNADTKTATTNAYYNPTTDFYSLTTVADRTWEIEDVIDFDNDGIGDILWRNYGTGADDKGKNIIWGMTSGGDLNPAKFSPITRVDDTTWEIEGVADYTRDGIPDIVWRNYGTGADKGKNIIWGMKIENSKAVLDTTKTSQIIPVEDLAWEIEGPSPKNELL
ncbi:MAG: hypothetical protein HC903_11770 [Methylacidiphilales bacterium]|nr:hypothetical protein [Candidatus Methylacidiphilales bacterium]NJR17818.1 hypothetical protein [Calothrix sp. CSU_2_0]